MADQKSPGRVIRVSLKRIGQLELVGLDALTETSGLEYMPHPFAHTRSSPFSGMDEYTRYANALVDRVHHGELRDLGKWFASYRAADLRVECLISRAKGAAPQRLMAHRRADAGYLAAQQPDEDVLDVYALSPFELGAAIAGSVELSNPGTRSKIVIPELAGRRPGRQEGADSVPLRSDSVTNPDEEVVPSAQITAFARVQSRWQPAREWGFDRQKKAVVWVHVEDDGDYIYAPGFTHLTPLTTRGLSRRIDQLIAEDIAALTEAAEGS